MTVSSFNDELGIKNAGIRNLKTQVQGKIKKHGNPLPL